jgi:hypothetical protein
MGEIKTKQEKYSVEWASLSSMILLAREKLSAAKSFDKNLKFSIEENGVTKNQNKKR